MDIVVINLASQPQRWLETQRRFAAAGLAPERLEAVDGRAAAAASLGYDPALNRRQHHKPLRPGEIGCYASHLVAWRRLLDSRARVLAVFEDDVEIEPGLAPVLEAIDRVPTPWDMVKLYGRARERVAWRRPLVPAFDLIGYRRVPSHTCAYVLSRRGAHKLLASRARFGRPIDLDLRHWWENELDILGVLPYPVQRAPESRQSSIDDGRRGCQGLGMRLHKLALQLQYVTRNAVHGVARGPARGTAAPPAAAPAHRASHGDLA
jgi:glycosyl transferase, family 25